LAKGSVLWGLLFFRARYYGRIQSGSLLDVILKAINGLEDKLHLGMGEVAFIYQFFDIL
jgi:hypothetical protein